MSDKMSKEERMTAELAVQHLHETVESLKYAYKEAYSLAMTYGWDLDYDEISKAAMLAGLEALDIADSIAAEDGWGHHKSKKETK